MIWDWIWGVGIALVVHSVIVFTAIGHALLNKTSSRSTFGWIGFILYAPIVGVIGYWLFGVNRVRTRSKKLGEQAQLEKSVLLELYPEQADHTHSVDDTAEHFSKSEWSMLKIGRALTNVPLSPNNRVLPLHNGEEAYPVMLDAIRRAKVSVWMTTYIFETNAKGLEFIDALVAAKDRGVDVRVIIDGVGEFYALPLAGTRLRRAGVRVARFLPPKLIPPQVFVNLRNHRKLLVVDGLTAFSGGMNIGGRHMAADPDNKNPVHDVHFLFRGPLVYDFARLFLDDWVYSNRHDRREEVPLPDKERVRFLQEQRTLRRRKQGPQSADTGAVEVSYPRHISASAGAMERLVPGAVERPPTTESGMFDLPPDERSATAKEVGATLVQMRRAMRSKEPEAILALQENEDADAWCRLIKDGPDERLNKLETLLSSVIACAQKRVLIVSPYFLPTTSIKSALVTARLRGVDVTIVVPEETNEPIVHAAMFRSVGDIIEQGVKIWMQPPPFAHSKIVIIDDSYTLLGSANIDPRSLRLNFELGVEVMDPALVTRLMQYYEPIIDASKELTTQVLNDRPFYRKLFGSIAWLFSPYL